MYFPKSRILTSQIANSGEFITEDGRPYLGSYYITYDGRYFAGINPQTTQKLSLIKIENPTGVNSKKPQNRDSIIFDNLNKGNINVANLLEPIPFYPKPTEKDYFNKKITRYFAKQRIIRNFKIIEINKETYDDIYNEKGIYNYPLWKVTSLFWQISGPLYDERPNGVVVRAGVIDTNQRIIDNKEKTFSGIKQYLTNLQQLAGINEIKVNKPGKLFDLNKIDEEDDFIYYNVVFQNNKIEVVVWKEREDGDNNLQIQFFDKNLSNDFENYLKKIKVEYGIDRDIDANSDYIYLDFKYFNIK